MDNFSTNQDKGDYIKVSLTNVGVSIKKRNADPLKNVKDSDIDYKNIKLLNDYISERGKIISGRMSGVPLKKQKRIAKAIKRARNLALLSFIEKIEEEQNESNSKI
ncbi:MAG: 30S ribosomal protein S18 [Rickettsiales bacterium]|jgi:small subunit ribosomal protein S18|nr:30S ribosomal protein S18 [Rickettsiales bacterium]